MHVLQSLLLTVGFLVFMFSQYLRLQSSFTTDARLVSQCVRLRRVREQLLVEILFANVGARLIE